MTALAVGEGYHNWHHAHPRDYACSEHGWWNPTKVFIDATAAVGLSADRHRPARARALRAGGAIRCGPQYLLWGHMRVGAKWNVGL